jgi:hypothetical protein
MSTSKTAKALFPAFCIFLALFCQGSILFSLGMLLKPSANDDQKNPSISVRLFKPAPPVIKPPIKVTKQTSNMVTRKILNKLKQNQAQKQSLDVYEKVSRLNAAKIKKKQKQPKKPPAKSIKKIRKTPSKPKPVKKLTIKPEPPPTQPEKPTEIHEPKCSGFTTKYYRNT